MSLRRGARAARNASPEAVNRMVCYCDDCQAFVHYLGHADLLDAHGGTDIVQMAPAACRSPAATSASSACALFRKAFTGGMRVAAIHRWATRSVRQSRPSGSSLRCLRTTRRQPTNWSGALGKIIVWRLRGQGWPHPCFDGATGAASHPITTLSQRERDALRPLCGPHPASGTAGR